MSFPVEEGNRGSVIRKGRALQRSPGHLADKMTRVAVLEHLQYYSFFPWQQPITQVKAAVVNLQHYRGKELGTLDAWMPLQEYAMVPGFIRSSCWGSSTIWFSPGCLDTIVESSPNPASQCKCLQAGSPASLGQIQPTGNMFDTPGLDENTVRWVHNWLQTIFKEQLLMALNQSEWTYQVGSTQLCPGSTTI